MICKQCNNEISDNAKFCPICGTMLEVKHNVCPRCNSIISKNDCFCKNCGFDLSRSNTCDIVLNNETESNKFSYFKRLCNVITIVMALIFILLLFVDYYAASDNGNILRSFVNDDLAFLNSKTFNIITVFKELNFESDGILSEMTLKFGYHSGIIFYITMLIFLLSKGVLSIGMIVCSVIGIIKNKFVVISKYFAEFILSIDLFLLIGLSCNGISIILSLIVSALLFGYYTIIEYLSLEKKFYFPRFLTKNIYLLAVILLLISASYGFMQVINIDTSKQTGSLLGDVLIKLQYINNTNFSQKVISNYIFISSFALLVGAILSYTISRAVATLVHSLSNESVELPYKRLIVGFVAFLIIYALDYAFISYANTQSELISDATYLAFSIPIIISAVFMFISICLAIYINKIYPLISSKRKKN